MDIRSLKKLWDQDKEFYKKVEVGTGVQSFVKKVIESEDIFHFKEGKLSTKSEFRKNEFIYEKQAKEKRKADFYIYITSDIAVPVEVECFGNLKAGATQLLSYQKDFDKHYGILTDGYEWKFYNNNLVIQSFVLDDIFDRPDIFSTFWAEYIKPEFYYLSFFEKVGQLEFVEVTKLGVEDNRQLFFEDITKLIRSFKNKLQIEGYLEADDKKTREKAAIELTYAYIIQFILYKTLVDNDFDDFLKEFEVIVTKIHASLKDKRYKDILGVIEGISAKISKNVYRPFVKEQDFIRDKIQELYRSIENSLSDVSPWLDIFIFIKKYTFANVKNEIFGYIYENYLKELYEESKKGQYFTDPTVVNFMLDQIGYTPEAITQKYKQDKNSVSIIDPSCGSGTFLYSATDAVVKAFQDGYTENDSKKIEEIVTNNIFGLDIEEFPLYLAEMSIVMRLLPLIINEKYNNPIDKKIKVFKTQDSVSEFINTSIRNTINDSNVIYDKNKGQTALFEEFEKNLNLGYSSYVRDEGDLDDLKRSLENRPGSNRYRFDYVIGNPPYVSYNESSKQKVLIFEAMKRGDARLNNIYGVNLHSIPGRQKKYAPKPNLYAFFIATGWALLKEGGRLCYIVPQTLLTAGDLDVLRYHLAKFATINKIITFSGKMFLGRGLKQNKPVATSSLIFVVTKKRPGNLHEVEIVNSVDQGDVIEILNNIKHGKAIDNHTILQGHLLEKINNWNFIKFDKITLEFLEAYRSGSDDFATYYDHPSAEHKFGDRFYFDGGAIVDPYSIVNEKDENFEIFDYKQNNYTTYTLKAASNKYYPKDGKLSFPQGSQGIKVYQQKYKIVWRTKDTPRFQFTDKDLLLVSNQSLLISTNLRSEALYLLAILNNPITIKLLELNLRQENEQSFLIPITGLKEYIRVPKIDIKNIYIKKQATNLTEKLLDLEKPVLSDFVDFSKVLEQKFDKIDVDGSYLILEKNNEKLQLSIKNNSQLIAKIMKTHFNQQNLGLEKNIISLSELMSLPVIDVERQKEIKEAVDNLVFCLYLDIYVQEGKIDDTKFVKSLCKKNRFYKLVNRI